jgi:hypothetical protein
VHVHICRSMWRSGMCNDVALGCMQAVTRSVGDLQQCMHACMQKQVVARGGGKSPNEHAIMRVELVQAKTVWEYQPGPKETFYKITCSMPNLVTTTRSVNLSPPVQAVPCFAQVLYIWAHFLKNIRKTLQSHPVLVS